MKASDIPNECLLDPQFVKVLTASLCSQIAESKRILADTDGEIEGLKGKVEQDLEKRKVLKQINKDLKQKKIMQEAALESLERDGKNRSIEVETIRNGLDDASLRQEADRAKFENILQDYEVMWREYKAAYEEFPLAKKREESRIAVRKLEIQFMIVEYKRDEFVKMLNQRKEVDAMRIRAAGVDIAEMVLNRWKDEKYLEYVQRVFTELKIDLEALDSELSQLQEEDEKMKLAEIETSKMPPPRLNFSFMRSVYTSNTRNKGKRSSAMSSYRESDAISVNTLMLEEMCKDAANERKVDNAEISNEPIDSFRSQTDTNAPESIIVDESNIQDKLRNLGIEKKKADPYSEEAKYNDNNMVPEEKNDYVDGREESLRRTRRWCEEARKECTPYLLAGHGSKRVNELRQAESNDEALKSGGRKVTKALSTHESETGLAYEPSNISSSKWSLYNEKEIDQSETLSQVSLLGKRKHQRNNDGTNDGPEELNDNATIVSQMSDDNSETLIKPSINRPKIIAIDKINYPLGKRAGQMIAENTLPYTNLVTPRNYVPSCMSSDHVSIAIESALLEENARGTFVTECEETAGYPLMSISENLSPRVREQSVTSFCSTTLELKNDSPNNRGRDPKKEKDPVPPIFFDNNNRAEPSGLKSKFSMFF